MGILYSFSGLDFTDIESSGFLASSLSLCLLPDVCTPPGACFDHHWSLHSELSAFPSNRIGTIEWNNRRRVRPSILSKPWVHFLLPVSMGFKRSCCVLPVQWNAEPSPWSSSSCGPERLWPCEHASLRYRICLQAFALLSNSNEHPKCPRRRMGF